MTDYCFRREYLDGCAAKVVKIEKKLTNEQLNYLHEYYRINQYPGLWGTEEIAKQWNIDDFDFHMDLMEWFFCRRMAEIALEHRRSEAKVASA
ncbi:unnamed protein product [Rotaria sordida]|uniref:Uncharacterized protein n=2 Tax=Rotaria sordida TaxID=392033 RepID=A0A814P029_9BILA|nr:unnamed protein product [Rotaria sordida]CAF1100923.1 unnamed protein product [Rotaria sordida]CAF1148092.1 unnamed protein product [Rotaria sordida]CAF1148265.1 unnamed protein product [Rotaria sordida]CAF4200393.1 unnamed protein product [Rotaria sordida]